MTAHKSESPLAGGLRDTKQNKNATNIVASRTPFTSTDDLFKCRWEWLDLLPSSDPTVARLQAANTVADARTAVFIWADNTVAALTCHGNPNKPPFDETALALMYAFGSTQRQRLAMQRGAL